MNEKELKYYKNKLLKEKEKLLKVVRRVQEDSLKSDDSSGDDIVDKSLGSSEREHSYLLASNETDILYWIEEALKKIDNGDYGICERCNTNISHRRLEIKPYAIYCIDCIEDLEKNIGS